MYRKNCYEAQSLLSEAEKRIQAFVSAFEDDQVMKVYGMLTLSHEFIGLQDVLSNLENYLNGRGI